MSSLCISVSQHNYSSVCVSRWSESHLWEWSHRQLTAPPAPPHSPTPCGTTGRAFTLAVFQAAGKSGLSLLRPKGLSIFDFMLVTDSFKSFSTCISFSITKPVLVLRNAFCDYSEVNTDFCGGRECKVSFFWRRVQTTVEIIYLSTENEPSPFILIYW